MLSLKNIGFEEPEEEESEEQEVVHFTAVFVVDPHFGFVPDWM